jgi:hypothetical protein
MKKLFYTFLAVAFLSSCGENEEVKKNDPLQVETRSATDITDTRATLWGRMLGDGYSMASSFGIELNDKKNRYATIKADSFCVYLNNLKTGQAYSYRAYAIDDDDNTVYGSVKEFKTLIPSEFQNS